LKSFAYFLLLSVFPLSLVVESTHCLIGKKAWGDEKTSSQTGAKTDLAPAVVLSGKILQLELDPLPKPAPVLFEPVGESLLPFVEISGRFKRPGWTLSYEGDEALLDSQSRFRLRIRVISGLQILRLYAVDPWGHFEMQDIEVEAPNLDQIGTGGTGGSGPSSLFLTHGISYTSITYKDTRLPIVLNMGALTAKLSYLYLLFPPRWDLSASAYYTAAQLSSNHPTNSPRFFGANFRLGYQLLPQGKDWQLTLGGGFFYSTMIVPTGGYGFNDVVGPQILPVLKYTLKNQQTLAWYTKAALITGGSEFATGFSYTFPLKNRMSWSLSIDYSQIKVQIESVVMQSNNVSFGASFTL
jgi:hypothetical protein